MDGFDLHASAAVRATNRDRLERMCRYLLRPPVANERLSETEGLVLLALPRPWSDGSTHLAFTPTELVERLAALVPRPHVSLILYHGVLAAHARLRPRVVEAGPVGDQELVVVALLWVESRYAFDGLLRMTRAAYEAAGPPL